MTDTDLNPYADAARNAAIRGLNAAAAWDEHPTYNTRPSVLRGITLAIGALIAVQEAESGQVVGGREIVAGVDLAVLYEVATLVKNRTGTTNGAIRAAVVRALHPAQVAS